jgi:hypothetical protein
LDHWVDPYHVVSDYWVYHSEFLLIDLWFLSVKARSAERLLAWFPRLFSPKIGLLGVVLPPGAVVIGDRLELFFVVLFTQDVQSSGVGDQIDPSGAD